MWKFTGDDSISESLFAQNGRVEIGISPKGHLLMSYYQPRLSMRQRVLDLLRVKMNTPVLHRLRIATRVIIYLVLLIAAFAGGWAGFLQLTGNIHAVTDGVVYRSAQLNGARLVETLQQYGIKSVINLRGDNVGDEWYTNELQLTTAQGAVHYDIGMYAKSQPDAATVTRIFEVLRTAPRPILIHCSSGSDRSGLVAAIYKHFIEGRSVHESEEQLSFRYGHFPWFGSGTVAMDEAFQRLVATKNIAGAH
jgi:protein tyrosine phosphatase (PTP) superfamily phosphohydrolase (DUF442 family)